MTDSVVKLSDILAKAARDHAASLSLDDHGFNWHALCLPAYLAERHRLAGTNTSPASHIAPHRLVRIDRQQGGAPC